MRAARWVQKFFKEVLS